jgi:hypothetical protein
MAFGLGDVVDFTTFQHPNLITVALSSATLIVMLTFFVPTGFAFLLFYLPTAASLAMAPLTISVAVYMAYSNLTEFFDDVLRFLSLDLEGPSSKLSWQVVVHP